MLVFLQNHVVKFIAQNTRTNMLIVITNKSVTCFILRIINKFATFYIAIH